MKIVVFETSYFGSHERSEAIYNANFVRRSSPLDKKKNFSRSLNEAIRSYCRPPHKTNCLGSAFSAKKQSAPVVQDKGPLEDGSDGVVDQEAESLDGLSDEELEFINSFDILKKVTASVPPPPKKLKQRTSLPLIVCSLKSCSDYRILNYPLVTESESKISIMIPLNLRYFLMRFVLFRPLLI